MKIAIRKTALLNQRTDRFHVTIIVKKGDAHLAIPILRDRLFWPKHEWEIGTEKERYFVFRVKTLPEDIKEFFKEFNWVYKKLRAKSLNFRIVADEFWRDGNGNVTTNR